ncbi:TonB-dependent receptor [Sphingobium sp. Z007]|uniref:TonB-dependent receptor n=1 Tax=Sphingobium sp. Z007 TaxID=627495 RepID=UPI000B49B0E1|nr:TonB-dependent receptor [Sphingobium sp. Z007]
MMKCVYRAALGAASMFAITAAMSAQAQQAPAPQAAAQPDSYTDIVVTAQRREERLVDVPASIVAISGEQLARAGVNGMEDLTRQAPGVIINKTGAYLQPTVRGIGASVQGGGAESNVAIYVDGVYVASQTGAMFDLANLESVQILKGPQGTLFGRNATGGAILITTRDPGYDLSGQINASYGRFNEYKLSAYLTTGLTDTLAVDMSAYYRASDGFVRDLRTDALRGEQSSLDLRSKLLFEPTEDVKFVLSGSHNETNDPSGLNYTSLNGNTVGRNFPNALPVATDRRHVSQELPTRIDTNTDAVSLNGSVKFDFATLNLISGYRTEVDYIETDLDSSYAPASYATYDQFNDSFSQEINFTSPAGRDFSWVVGVFYYWNAAGSKSWDLNGRPFYKARITSDSISGFADGTYDLGKISVIAGLRYSSEKRRFKRGLPGGAFTVDTSATFNSWTPRFGLRYDVGDRSNIYATFSKGFKSGLYNISSPSIIPVRPEKIDAYEIGFKSASRTLDFNAAAYFYNYKDIQVTAYDYTSGISRLFNAAQAEVYGFEMDAAWRPSTNFDARAAISYTHAAFTNFPGAPAFTPSATFSNGTPCPDRNCGNVQSLVDASGNQMLRAPELTLSAAANYRIPLDNGGEVAFGVRPYWSSKINYSFQERIQQPSYFTLDADISWSLNDQVRLTLWGRNLTNAKFALSRSESSARDAIAWAQPASYGIAGSYKF